MLALLMFALQAYIAGAVESWTVAGAFGQRRFVSLTPLIVLGLAALFSVIPPSRRPVRLLVSAVVVLCVWWNLGLMAQFGMNTMDRQRLDAAGECLADVRGVAARGAGTRSGAT